MQMIDDENYNQAKKVRDWTKSLFESLHLTNEQRKPSELILVIMDSMLELQALPEDTPKEEFQAKIAAIAELQQRALDLGVLAPGPSKGNTTKGLELSFFDAGAISKGNTIKGTD